MITQSVHPNYSQDDILEDTIIECFIKLINRTNPLAKKIFKHSSSEGLCIMHPYLSTNT